MRQQLKQAAMTLAISGVLVGGGSAVGSCGDRESVGQGFVLGDRVDFGSSSSAASSNTATTRTRARTISDRTRTARRDSRTPGAAPRGVDGSWRWRDSNPRP